MGSDRNPGIVSTAGLAKVAGELRELPRQRVTTHGGVRIQALPDEQRIVAEWVRYRLLTEGRAATTIEVALLFKRGIHQVVALAHVQVVAAAAHVAHR